MCAFCAQVREQCRIGLDDRSSSSSSQLEQRVGTLETLAQRLEQSLSQALQKNIDLSEAVGRLQTLVENVQQELGQALQRVEELEATVENWQQEQWQENWQQEEWQLTGGSPSFPSSHQ